MKKYFLMLLPVLFLAAVSVGFTSCGDDEEVNLPSESANRDNPEQSHHNDTPDQPNSLLVGTWKYTFSSGSGYQVLQFNSDGVVYSQEYDENDGGWHKKHTYSYRYDESQKKLYLTKSESVREYEVRELSTTTLTLYDIQEGSYGSSKAMTTYTRIDSDNPFNDVANGDEEDDDNDAPTPA